jgi:hypothetical protein
LQGVYDKTGHGDLKLNKDRDKGASNTKVDHSVVLASSSGATVKQPASNIKIPYGKHDHFNCCAILQRLSGEMIRNLISPLDRLPKAERQSAIAIRRPFQEKPTILHHLTKENPKSTMTPARLLRDKSSQAKTLTYIGWNHRIVG